MRAESCGHDWERCNGYPIRLLVERSVMVIKNGIRLRSCEN